MLGLLACLLAGWQEGVPADEVFRMCEASLHPHPADPDPDLDPNPSKAAVGAGPVGADPSLRWLAERDQLTVERRKGTVFHGFEEGDIARFMPT